VSLGVDDIAAYPARFLFFLFQCGVLFPPSDPVGLFEELDKAFDSRGRRRVESQPEPGCFFFRKAPVTPGHGFKKDPGEVFIADKPDHKKGFQESSYHHTSLLKNTSQSN